MILLQTESVHFMAFLLLAVFVLLVFFITKLFVAGRLMKRLVSEKPIILIMGVPNSGKSEILKKLTNMQVITKTYPFVGRFRVCDVSVKHRNYRYVCFHCINKRVRFAANSIRLLGKKPAAIVYVVRISPDIRSVRLQKAPFNDVKKLYKGVPIIPVLNDYDASKKVSVSDVRKIFGKDLVSIPVSHRNGLRKLKAIVEKKTFPSKRK